MRLNKFQPTKVTEFDGKLTVTIPKPGVEWDVKLTDGQTDVDLTFSRKIPSIHSAVLAAGWMGPSGFCRQSYSSRVTTCSCCGKPIVAGTAFYKWHATTAEHAPRVPYGKPQDDPNLRFAHPECLLLAARYLDWTQATRMRTHNAPATKAQFAWYYGASPKMPEGLHYHPETIPVWMMGQRKLYIEAMGW